MPKLLEEIYRLQADPAGLDAYEQRLLKMCGNLLERKYKVQKPRNKLTVAEYMHLPGRWELLEGWLYPDEED